MGIFKDFATSGYGDVTLGALQGLNEAGISVNGMASDTDTMMASANAYIIALNKLIDKRKKRASKIDVSKSQITK